MSRELVLHLVSRITETGRQETYCGEVFVHVPGDWPDADGASAWNLALCEQCSKARGEGAVGAAWAQVKESYALADDTVRAADSRLALRRCADAVVRLAYSAGGTVDTVRIAALDPVEIGNQMNAAFLNGHLLQLDGQLLPNGPVDGWLTRTVVDGDAAAKAVLATAKSAQSLKQSMSAFEEKFASLENGGI